MIEKEDADGVVTLNFHDWTPAMMALCCRLHQLPLRRGRSRHNHEVGIDRLARLKYGREMIDALFDIADEMPFAPNHCEVVTLGQRVLAMRAEMALLRRSRASRGRLERQQARQRCRSALNADLATKPVGTPRFGFVRGNCGSRRNRR